MSAPVRVFAYEHDGQRLAVTVTPMGWQFVKFQVSGLGWKARDCETQKGQERIMSAPMSYLETIVQVMLKHGHDNWKSEPYDFTADDGLG